MTTEATLTNVALIATFEALALPRDPDVAEVMDDTLAGCKIPITLEKAVEETEDE